MRNPVWPSSCVTPADASNELDVQNKWEENTQNTDQMTTSRIGNLTRLIHTLAICVTIHTTQGTIGSPKKWERMLKRERAATVLYVFKWN